MNTKLVLTLAIAAVLLLAVLPAAETAHGQTTAFIISNADAVAYISTTVSSQLNTLIANVSPRFVVQYANDLRYYNLPPISRTLTSLMAQVGDRFVIQYANANRFYSFTYPLAMIGDTVPPQISMSPTVSFGGNAATIAWISSEFATTVFRYGTQPGDYSQIITHGLYFKLHEFTVSGLTPGQTYYYQFSHTDRSSNVFNSGEYHFVAQVSLYLPLLRK